MDVAADGYRLRLVDVPAAFDRDAYYDYPDDPWRFAVFCRAALAALRRDGRPVDVLNVHDWHTGPALLDRARADAAGDEFFARTAVVATLHNLAYHGWTGLGSIGQLGLRPGEPLAGANPDGVDLLLTAIERSEIANTVSPGFAREALTPAFGMGLDGALARQGQPVPRHPQRHRPGRLGPGERPGARRAVLAAGAGRQGSLPARPAAPRRVRRR